MTVSSSVSELRPYQRDAVDFLHRSQRAIFAYAPGTGKTATVAAWLADEHAQRTLIVAPNGPVLEHWERESGRFWEFCWPVIGTGTPKNRAGSRDFIVAGGCDDASLIINYELLRQDIDELIKIQWDAVVFDESHRLKNRKALVFKAAAKLARRTPRIVLVTGTPILNRADELWTSLHMLDPDRFKSFWRWAEYHFDVVSKRYRGRPVREVGDLKKGHASMLRKELSACLLQRPISELLPDLPDVSETYLPVQLSSDERKAYDSMNEHFWMAHGDQLTVAPNVVAKSLRLRQLVSDWSAFGEHELGAKANAAVSLVEDLEPEQVVIFAAFRETVNALHRAIPESVPYHGGMSPQDRHRALHSFIDGHHRVLVGTLGTLAEGIDGLQVARHVIFLDRDWTPARNDQAVARLARSGQKSSVNVIHLFAEDTIDDVVADALRRKVDVIAAVLGGQRAVHHS